ncbi:hypothetical protein PMM47T1_14015 [Pseudomonas sp. M47T1]|uniref:hypothetical protein n=1 Tax=Pseudomonas sp. M47T1 TaxID=1179778 RepID=UPI000260882F|nr:hypothetical protein [Pseudomonas sp. M47T1]EIK96081.1 hypothetical protein PMM47T1_14015 [Pseudomonas sp. M47T1]
MPDETSGIDLEELLDGDELELLKEEAARRGTTPAELAKSGIQQQITKRTKPKAMTGVIQAFRRKD